MPDEIFMVRSHLFRPQWQPRGYWQQRPSARLLIFHVPDDESRDDLWIKVCGLMRHPHSKAGNLDDLFDPSGVQEKPRAAF